MARTVADQFVDTLAAAGVRRVWGVVGDSLNGLTDALRRHGGVEWLHVRHEEAGAFAAAGEAATSGELAVCAGSCGPGNLHLINGLYDSQRSRVPVLAIAAQIPSPELGSGYFQETHPESLFKECSGYCELVTSAAQAPRVIENAIRRAVADRCVAVVVIPGDVALLPAADRPRPAPASLVLPTRVGGPDEATLDALAAFLAGAERIAILAGGGCAGAKAELLQLAETLKAPIVHALGGKTAVEADNPYDVGMTGLIGFSSGYHAMRECDALLMLGTDFPYPQFYPDHARVAQVDLRPEVIARRHPIELGVVGDVGATLAALLPRLQSKADASFLERAQAHYRKARAGLDELAQGKPGGRLHPQHVARVASQLAAADAVFTCDVGLPTVWAARHVQLGGGRRLLGSYWHGSMACAMPLAMGAQALDRGRQVVSLSGDGGFTMLMGDLLSLKQLDLPVKLIVFNNGALGFIELEQKSSGFLDTDTGLDNPDFARLAEAVGIKGVRIEDPAELEAKLSEAFAHPGPVVIDTVVSRQELAMPPAVTAGMAKGFTLYMLKAVLNGRADEVVELARANLFR